MCMKKNITLFMMLLAAVAMTGCSSDEKKELAPINKSVVGYWQLVQSYQFSDPLPINTIQVAEFGNDGTMTYYEDGEQTKRLPYRIKKIEGFDEYYLYYNTDEDYEYDLGETHLSVDGDFLKITDYNCFYQKADIYHRISSLDDVERGEVGLKKREI